MKRPEASPAPDPSGRLDPARAAMSAFSGYAIWGLSPIFYKLLDFASASEIVLQRAIWSVPTLLVILALARRTSAAFAVLTDWRTLGVLALTSVLIGANWWVFIFAVNTGRVLEVSLGYFINPLMYVAVGVLIAHERFGRLRALAVALAALGVLNQIVMVGEVPVMALFLAASFTLYSYVRRKILVDGRIGLFWETAILAVPSLIAVSFIEMRGAGSFFEGPWQAFLLIATGPMTAAPLLLFLMGARGLSFAIIGAMQFVAPTLQFFVGLAYGEPFSPAHLVTFTLIWAGLAVFVLDLIRFERTKHRKLQDI